MTPVRPLGAAKPVTTVFTTWAKSIIVFSALHRAVLTVVASVLWGGSTRCGVQPSCVAGLAVALAAAAARVNCMVEERVASRGATSGCVDGCALLGRGLGVGLQKFNRSLRVGGALWRISGLRNIKLCVKGSG